MNVKEKMSTVELLVSASIGSFIVTCCAVQMIRVVKKAYCTPVSLEPIICLNPITDHFIAEMIYRDASEDLGRSSKPKSPDTSDDE
jgi:hypothetical protein